MIFFFCIFSWRRLASHQGAARCKRVGRRGECMRAAATCRVCVCSCGTQRGGHRGFRSSGVPSSLVLRRRRPPGAPACGAAHRDRRACAVRRAFWVGDASCVLALSAGASVPVRRAFWVGNASCVLTLSAASSCCAAGRPLVQMRASQLLFTKLVGMWDSPNWNSDGTWDGQGSGHDFWGTVSLCGGVHAR